MTSINTNAMATIASNALTRNERAMSTSMERLSTGLRINSAKDDAAGLAIAKKMGAQIVSLRQSVKNANDGISMLQTFEGASKEITSMLTRMRELATQYANGTLTTEDQDNLDAEYTALVDEIGRVVTATTWNTSAYLDGGEDITLQIGAGSADTMDVTIMDWATDVHAALTDLATDDVDAIDKVIEAVTTEQANYGAYITRLEHAADNLLNVALNTDASRGRIEDADYALETTELARTQIIAQAGTAMLAQANQAKQSVLALLK